MQTGAIIRRNAGCFIPNDYLELALKANPTGWGAAVVTKNDGVTSLEINHGDSGLTLEFVQDTMKTFEKNEIVFYICNSDTALDVGDMSPHVILSKEDEPCIVAFIDGNFPGYAKEKSSHPAEFFFAQEFLIPKFTDMADMANGDLDKIMSATAKPFFKKEMLLHAVSRGTVLLVASTGAVANFSIDGASTEYPWGWVSNSYGYSMDKKEKEAEPEKAKSSMFPGKNKTVSTVREKAPAAVAHPGASDGIKPPTSSASVIENYSIGKWKPDSTMSRQFKKNGYQQRIGYCPDRWEDNIEINVYLDPKGKLLTFAEFKRLGLDGLKLPPLNNPKAKHEKQKDTTPHNIPQPDVKSSAEKTVTAEVLPIMSPDTKKHIRALMSDTAVQKLIAENADIIEDPRVVKNLEAKFADFASQLGMKSIDDFLMWNYEMYYDLAKERPDGIATMCWNFKNIIAGRRAQRAERIAKEAATHEVAKEELKPAKQSMFPGKTKAA